MGLGSWFQDHVVDPVKEAVSDPGSALDHFYDPLDLIESDKLDDPFSTGASSAARNARNQSARMMDLYEGMFETVEPGILKGIEAQGDLAGYVSSPEALNNLYGDVFEQISGPDSFLNPLIDERMRHSEQALAKSGLRRSGARLKEAARIPTEIITGAGSDLVSQILGGLGNVGSLGSNLLGGGNSSLMGMNSASALGTQASLGQSQQQSQMLGGLVSALGTAAAAFFSDPILKTNTRKIGEYKDLSIHEWDWIPGAEEVLGEELTAINQGFMSDEVREKYPEFVFDVDIGGETLMIIDYFGLVNHMETANDKPI